MSIPALSAHSAFEVDGHLLESFDWLFMISLCPCTRRFPRSMRLVAHAYIAVAVVPFFVCHREVLDARRCCQYDPFARASESVVCLL